MSLVFFISLFSAQHVSNVSTFIFRSLRLIVDLFHVLYCSGSMCVGVTVWFVWGGVVSLCRLKQCFSLHKDTTGEWRRLHNEELNDLYCSPNIVRVLKRRRMRWAGHVARMGEERGCIGSWRGNWRKGDHWGDLGVDGWIILERENGGDCITRS